MMKICECYDEYEDVQYLSDFEQGVHFALTGERIKSVKVKKSRCTGTKECESCSCGGDRMKCDFYPQECAEAKKEQKIEETKKKAKDLEELLYWMRTHMTSVTRYVFLTEDGKRHEEEYKALAQNAVNEILKIINGKGKKGYTYNLPRPKPKEEDGWICVTDRLPGIGEEVLVYTSSGEITTDHRYAESEVVEPYEFTVHTVKYWRPLPKKPE